MIKLQIEQEMCKIIEKITGIENSNIRISYQSMPSIEIDNDYCFVALSYFDSPFTKPIEVKFDGENEIEDYSATRGILANLIFYGNNAFENASKCKIMFNDASLTKNLRKESIFHICDTSEPRRVPVLLNEQWFDQVYLDLRFYQKIMYNTDRKRIESVDISLITDNKTKEIKGGK